MAATATKVNTCQVVNCAFNENKACHAWAVTIEDPSPATCSTYHPKAAGENGSGTKAVVANVGACKAAGCVHNRNLSCTAAEVAIGMQDGKVSCLTYRES